MTKYELIYNLNDLPFYWELREISGLKIGNFKTRVEAIHYYISLLRVSSLKIQNIENEFFVRIVSLHNAKINKFLYNIELLFEDKIKKSTDLTNIVRDLYDEYLVDYTTHMDMIKTRNERRLDQIKNTFIIYNKNTYGELEKSFYLFENNKLTNRTRGKLKKLYHQNFFNTYDLVDKQIYVKELKDESELHHLAKREILKHSNLKTFNNGEDNALAFKTKAKSENGFSYYINQFRINGDSLFKNQKLVSRDTLAINSKIKQPSLGNKKNKLEILKNDLSPNEVKGTHSFFFIKPKFGVQPKMNNGSDLDTSTINIDNKNFVQIKQCSNEMQVETTQKLMNKDKTNERQFSQISNRNDQLQNVDVITKNQFVKIKNTFFSNDEFKIKEFTSKSLNEVELEQRLTQEITHRQALQKANHQLTKSILNNVHKTTQLKLKQQNPILNSNYSLNSNPTFANWNFNNKSIISHQNQFNNPQPFPKISHSVNLNNRFINLFPQYEMQKRFTNIQEQSFYPKIIREPVLQNGQLVGFIETKTIVNKNITQDNFNNYSQYQKQEFTFDKTKELEKTASFVKSKIK